MAEGLAAIRAEGIKPVSPTPIPAGWMPPLLRLPDMIFEAMLGRTMKIDPEARSSMWEDLQRGRRTEIDYLQGVITEIAERRGLDAPLSRRIVELIRKAELDGKGLARADAGTDPWLIDLQAALEMATICANFVEASRRERRYETNRRGASGGCRRCRLGSLIPAHAAPPTATPSPGYDARLQEQRAASRAVSIPGRQPVAQEAARALTSCATVDDVTRDSA